jgi:acetoin utilization deacetylase AcuC-like enzyme
MTEALGNGAARGGNLNIPLPPGSGSGAYRAAFEELVLPALEAFAPDAIFLPCGYDASALDPLGVMMLSSDDFRWMTRKIIEFAERVCNGKVIVTHEGGYSATYVPYCGLAVLEELSGASAIFCDPFAPDIRGYGGQALSNDQSASITRSKELFFGSKCAGQDPGD